MDWQLAAVVVLVAGAVAYVARQTWRTWAGRKSGCGGGCGCASKSAGQTASEQSGSLIPSERLTLRRRN